MKTNFLVIYSKRRCKKAIDDIIKRGGNLGSNENGNGGALFRNNVEILEIMIPGNKVGFLFFEENKNTLQNQVLKCEFFSSAA
jgi:hypothetical protein